MSHWRWKTCSRLTEFGLSGLIVFMISYVGASTFRNYVGYISAIDGSSMTVYLYYVDHIV